MSNVRLSAYQVMWLFVMFDLPTVTKTDKKNAAKFRKDIEKDGFTMYQFSVYYRFCASTESVDVHIRRIKKIIPLFGKISILTITDKQYSNIINIWGKEEKKNQLQPIQLEFF